MTDSARRQRFPHVTPPAPSGSARPGECAAPDQSGAPGEPVALRQSAALGGPDAPAERNPPAEPSAPAALYEQAAHDAAARVIARYSTSFGAAVRLLDEPARERVRDVYAMVRVADELVDGAAAHLATAELAVLLDRYEREVLDACERGFSTDLVVHAFALTARRTGIDAALITPFFASMRADLDVARHDAQSLSDYVHGSAEVVGLMCLRVFTADEADPAGTYERLAPGAIRLGAAFQKVNFLRDLGADRGDLGRDYLPGAGPGPLDEAAKARFVAEIDDDLRAAEPAVAGLPDSSRRAVRAAHSLFTALNRAIEATPAADLASRRVRVSDQRKAVLVARAVLSEARVPHLGAVPGLGARPSPGAHAGGAAVRGTGAVGLRGAVGPRSAVGTRGAVALGALSALAGLTGARILAARRREDHR